MTPADYEKRLFKVQKAAMRALPYMPRQSKYRTWSYAALAETLSIAKFLQLEARLEKFYGRVGETL